MTAGGWARTIGPGGTSANVTLFFSGPGCTWSVSSNAAWATPQNATSGTSTGASVTILFSISANSGGTPRHGAIFATVNGINAANFALDQNSTSCTYSFSPPTLNVPAAGGSGSFVISASPSDCWWSGTGSTPSWLTVSLQSGGTYSYSAQPNSGASRPATVGVTSDPPSAAVIVINQAGALTPVTLVTVPAGLQIVVDGATLTAPQSFTWAAGTTHTIGASSPQGSGGTRSVFTSWSDGGTQSHTITVPTTGITYTANFKTQYRLTANVSGAGEVTLTPNSTDGFYDSGSSVQLKADPAAQFLNWNGDLSGSTNPQTIVMSGPKSVTANFGSGVTITTSPPGLQIVVDGTTGTAPQSFTWAAGTTHTIGASSPQDSGGTRSAFTGWSDGGTQSHTITVPTTGITYTANFKTQYRLTATVSGAGEVTPTPNSTDGFYDNGSSVQLKADPDAQFLNWSGDLSGSTNPQTIVLSAPKSVTANFGSSVLTTINTSPPGLQIVVDGTALTAPKSFTWAAGTNHTIGATSPQGSGGIRSVFTSWSDGGEQSHAIIVPAVATTYTAGFKTQYLLTTTVLGTGTLTTTPNSADGFHDSGSSVQLKADPAAQFLNWSGDLSGSTNPQTIVMSAPKSVTANFRSGNPTSLLASPSSLNFDYRIGDAAPVAQTLSVSSSNPSSRVSVSASEICDWLTVSPAAANTPASFNVSVAPSGLPAGNYSCTISFSGGGGVNVAVTLQITEPTTLSVSPSSLSFTYRPGDPRPQQQSFKVASSNPSSGVAVTVTASEPCGWLTVTPTAGATLATFAALVSASGLAAGNYACTITLSGTGAVNRPPVQLSLTVIATDRPSLLASPGALSFAYEIGAPAPANQAITVTSSGAAVSFTGAAATTSGGEWLAVNPTNGSTPATLSVALKTAAVVVPGTYSGSVTISSAGVSAGSPIPVTLVVTAPRLTANPTELSFRYQQGGLVPAPQTVFVELGSRDSTLTFAAAVSDSSRNWLRVEPASGSLPASLAVSVAPSGLSAGTYTGTIEITIQGVAAITRQTITVSLTVSSLPTLTVAPKSLSFTHQPDSPTPPASQSVSVFTIGPAADYRVVATGGGLAVTPSSGQTPGSFTVNVNPSGLSANTTHTGQIEVQGTRTNPEKLVVPVTVVVGAPAPLPRLELTSRDTSFSLVQGAGPARGQFVVANAGGGVLNFRVEAVTSVCGRWLTVESTGGSVPARSSAAVDFAVNPTGLPAGVCTGEIRVTDLRSNALHGIAITLAVTAKPQTIQLTESGFQFTATPGGLSTLAQRFGIRGGGQAPLEWTVQTQTLGNRSGWLQVTPTGGIYRPGSEGASLVTVSVNAQGLEVGQYYGSVRVLASNAANSPQVVAVRLDVVDPSRQVTVQADPVGLLQVGAGTARVQLGNLSAVPVSYRTALSTEDGQPWLRASQASGTLAAGGTAQINIAVDPTGLAAGIRRGTLRVSLADGSVRTVSVASVLPGSTSSGAAAAKERLADGCRPSYLVPQMTTLEDNFSVPALQAVSLKVQVADDCGTLVRSGQVYAGFSYAGSSERERLSLAHEGEGLWSTTWVPRVVSSRVTLSMTAVSGTAGTVAGLIGQRDMTGSVRSSTTRSGGLAGVVVNSASFKGAGLIAPGSWVTVFGEGLATEIAERPDAPFPEDLRGTRVVVNDQPMKLRYVSGNQVNALIPFGVESNAVQQIVVQRETTLSVPAEVTVAEVQPGIYSVNQGGTGQGHIYVSAPDNPLAASETQPRARPVKAGEFLTIYCAGLGDVSNRPEPPESSARSEPLSRTLVTPVVTIGGVEAQVSFSGLAPGFVGLYQVNVQVPVEAPAGDSVPVVIRMKNLESNTVTIAVGR
ncbi:MAG: BACON domain-containing protein [Bryobacteraceae bacterium]